MPKTAKIILSSIKEPDAWQDLASELGISEEERKRHFLYGEYADIELEIDENLRVIGGRILPLPKKD